MHTYSKDAFEHLSKRPIAINPAEVSDNYISTIMIKEWPNYYLLSLVWTGGVYLCCLIAKTWIKLHCKDTMVRICIIL